ncbi:8627_t:CDS:1 [Cetraspora pellucida]|uniref:8627_t:CDS:1 n=1 Tax=Cetraspora pellucida TaxID=1433469 RepID=A0A9N9CNZ7_9GLOM|nr:8627_t:CDS:1 [Cetraspora pellucida]
MSSKNQSKDPINELSNKRLKISQSTAPQKSIPIGSTPLLKPHRRQQTLPMYLIVYEELPDGSTVERSVIDPRFPKYRTDDVYITQKPSNPTKISENIRKIPAISSTSLTSNFNKTLLTKTVVDRPITPLIRTTNNKDSCQEIQVESNERVQGISIDRGLPSDLGDKSERNENLSTQKLIGSSDGTQMPEIITIPDDDDDETPCYINRAPHSFYTDVSALSPTSSLDIEVGSEISDLEEIDLGKPMWEPQKHKDSQSDVEEGLNIAYVSENFCLPVIKNVIEIGSSEESGFEIESGDLEDDVSSSDDDYYTGFRIYDLIPDNSPDTMLQIINNSIPYDPKKLRQKRSITNNVGTVKRRRTRS